MSGALPGTITRAVRTEDAVAGVRAAVLTVGVAAEADAEAEAGARRVRVMPAAGVLGVAEVGALRASALDVRGVPTPAAAPGRDEAEAVDDVRLPKLGREEVAEPRVRLAGREGPGVATDAFVGDRRRAAAADAAEGGGGGIAPDIRGLATVAGGTLPIAETLPLAGLAVEGLEEGRGLTSFSLASASRACCCCSCSSSSSSSSITMI